MATYQTVCECGYTIIIETDRKVKNKLCPACGRKVQIKQDTFLNGLPLSVSAPT